MAQRPSTLSKKRHRFQRVGERVANLQTELHLHVKTNANEVSLTFKEELGLQGELTTIESFQLLYRRLQPLVTTTPQLLHHLRKIVKLLTAELRAEPVADIQRDRMIPVLKLLTALARELRKEFYPHFAGVLPHIVAVIDTKDPELSTQVFKTITMLFHFLRVQLLGDMDAVHQCYFPLLGHPKPFVRDFAAHTLSVLLRRIDSNKEMRKYLSTYLGALSRGSGHDNEILRDGSARLFFALLKNVNHGFHSRMGEVYVALLGAFRPKHNDGKDGGADAAMANAADAEELQQQQDARHALIYDIVSRTTVLMVNYTDAVNTSELLACVTLVLTKMIHKGERHAANDEFFTRVLSILLTVVKYRGGRLITGHAANLTALHSLCGVLLEPRWMLRDTTEALRNEVLALFEVVWRLSPPADDVMKTQMDTFFSAASLATDAHDTGGVAAYWRVALRALIERQILHKHVPIAFVRAFVFPNAIRLAFESLLPGSASIATDLYAFASLLCLLGDYVTAHSEIIDENSFILFRHGYRFLTVPPSVASMWIAAPKVTALVNDVLERAKLAVEATLDCADDNESLALAWKMCAAVALLDVDEETRLKFASALLPRVEKQLDARMREHQVDTGIHNSVVAWRTLRAELWRVQQIAAHQLAGTTSSSAVALVSKTKDKKAVSDSNAPAATHVWQALNGNESSFAMLSAFLEFVRMQDPIQQRALLTTQLLTADAERMFAANLRSPSRPLRLVTLEILSRFDRLTFLEDDSETKDPAAASSFVGACDVLDHALNAELLCASANVQVEREIVRHVTRVKVLCRAPQTPTLYKTLVVNHLFGLYHVKFSTLWPHVAEAIAAIIESQFAAVWPSVRDELWHASFRAELPTSPSSGSDKNTGVPSSLANRETDARIVVVAEFDRVCRTERGELDASAVTDTLTHHHLLWKGMEQWVDQLETKTKFFVPVFLLFLRDQYAVIYPSELEQTQSTATASLTDVNHALDKTLTAAPETHEWMTQHYDSAAVSKAATTRAVRLRIMDYLRVFAAFKNMKGAYAHTFLHAFFFELLMKSDATISKLALQCLYGFGKTHLAAYKDHLNRIADAATFREALTTFPIARDAGVVLSEHRGALLPVLMRLLYSKAVSKKGRNSGDTVGARRAAILSYLAALEADELVLFIELVVRAFDVKLRAGDNGYSAHSVTSVATSVAAVPNVEAVQPSRVLGFLNLLEDLIEQLGVHLTVFVPTLADVVLALLESNYKEREEEKEQQRLQAEADDGEDEDMPESAETKDGDQPDEDDEEADVEAPQGARSDGKAQGMRKQIRTLAYRRLAEMMLKFDARVPLAPWAAGALTVSNSAILHLPQAVIGADKASALLEFVAAVAAGPHARRALQDSQIMSVLSCLSTGLSSSNDKDGSSSRGIPPELLTVVLQFMSSMLDGDEQYLLKDTDAGDEDVDMEKGDSAAPFQLIPHIPFILAQFVVRFQSKAARYAQERYAGSSRRELAFLCRVSEHVHVLSEPANDQKALVATERSQVIPSRQQSAHDLFQLLLPFLQRNHHTSHADKINILQVLTRLVGLIEDSRKHIAPLAKLLAPGPNALTERSVRDALVAVFAAMGEQSHTVSGDAMEDVSSVSPLMQVATVLRDLNAYDARRIEDIDYETRVAALTAVNATKFIAFRHETWLLAPVLAQYLQSMHEDDYSVRSTALSGLTLFVNLTAQANEATDSMSDDSAAPLNSVVLLNLLESLVMPCLRASVRVPREDIRRGFILLLAELADARALHTLSYVPGDLALLRRADDVEVDFFYNLTHIQVHRKRRALQRLNSLMSEMAIAKRAMEASAPEAASVASEVTWFSNSTVNHLLLPLVMHFIYEAQAKSQDSLRHEAALCIGSAAGLLGWSHYLALLRRLLKSIEGHEEMETAIIASICAVIDHHHFSQDDAAVAKIRGWMDVKLSAGKSPRHKQKEVKKGEVAQAEAAASDDSATAAAETAAAELASHRVQDQMESQVLPLLKKYLFKAVTSKGASKLSNNTSFEDSIVSSPHVAVRVPLALAIVKVLRRLRVTAFYAEFPKLLVSFIKLLKNKDEAIRSSARVTLVRIVEELGTPFLQPIVEELRHTLQEGYKIHVLAYTLHVVLEKVQAIAQPRKPPSLLLMQQQQTGTGLSSAVVASGDAEADTYASDLDACLPAMLDIITEDLFRGVVENQDGSEHKSRMREAKSSTKSLDALELLARSITFLPNAAIHSIVAAVVTKFREQPENAKSVLVLQESMRRIALGLVKNSGVERSHVFLYVYNLLQACLESIRPSTEAEKAKYDAALTNTKAKKQKNPLVSAWQVNEKSREAAAKLARRVDPRVASRVELQSQMTGFNRHALDDEQRKTSRTHLDELLTFAVYLLFTFVRDGGTHGKLRDANAANGDAEAEIVATPAALVDPLVPLLMRCACESKNNQAVINSLKCLGVLLHHGGSGSSKSRNKNKGVADANELPSLDVALSPLVDRLFKILQKAGAATRNEMVQTCYRTMTLILRHRPAFRLTEAQLRVLVSFVRADLDERDHQNATYALLKSIIASRLVLPEIYDVVVRVGELLVRSDTQTARANCATIFITFLLEYPLGAKRLTQHLHFLLQNLTFQYESGRRAVLETLLALIKKLPLELINDKAQFLLLPLVLRLANEDAQPCRVLASEAIRTLIRRMGNQALNASVALIATWWPAPIKLATGAIVPELSSDKKTLLATAAQVTALVLECRPEFITSHAPAILASARSQLQRCLQAMQTHHDEQEVENDDATTSTGATLLLDWRVATHVLTCMERFSEYLVGPYESWLVDTPGFLRDDLVALLERFPHVSVRRGALRVVSSYLRRRSAATLAFREDVVIKKAGPELLLQSRVFLATPGALFAWASSVCKLLEKGINVGDDGNGQHAAGGDAEQVRAQVVAVLLMLCAALHANPAIKQHVSSEASTPEEEDAGAEADEDEDEGKEKEKEKEKEEEEEEEDDDDDDGADPEEEETTRAIASQEKHEREQSKTPLGWILTRLSYVARGAPAAVQMTVYAFFAAFVDAHEAPLVNEFVVQMVNPLYRTASVLRQSRQDPALHDLQMQSRMKRHRRAPSSDASEPPATALLAQEVLERLERKIGGPPFLEAYTFVQRKLAVFRATRREQRKHALVNDPQLAAQRKMQKNDQKKRAKQMRKRKFAVLKGTASNALRVTKARRPGAE